MFDWSVSLCMQSLCACACCLLFVFLMIRRPPRSTQSRSSAASDVYKRQVHQSRAHHHFRPDPRAEELDVDIAQPGEDLLLPFCLLYTSPSPRDRTRSRMPSSAWKKKTKITTRETHHHYYTQTTSKSHKHNRYNITNHTNKRVDKC